MVEMARLRAPIDTFFEDVIVNAEDAALRLNRLRLLARTRAAMRQVAVWGGRGGLRPPRRRPPLCVREPLDYDGAMTDALGWIAPGAPLLDEARFGTKAARLSRAAAAGLPVPSAFVLPADQRESVDFAAALETLAPATGLVSLRTSTIGPGSDMVPAVLNIGASKEALEPLTRKYGERIAQDLHRRFLHSYGVAAMGIDEEEFEYALHDLLKDIGLESETDLTPKQLAELASTYARVIEEEAGAPMPVGMPDQLAAAVGEMTRTWHAPRSKLRRVALGFDEDAPLALIVQSMVSGPRRQELGRRSRASPGSGDGRAASYRPFPRKRPGW